MPQINSQGKRQVVHLAKGGDILGFKAVLSGDTYSCSAITIEETILCAIPKKNFLEIAKTNAQIAFKLLELFSRKLKETEQSISFMAGSTVKERVCRALLLLKETFGFEPDKKTLKQPFRAKILPI